MGNDIPDKNRFIEANLNRCCSLEDMEAGISYESRRAKELEEILKYVDYHLDIHSTYSTPSKAVAISTERSRELV
jgi:succinylglutamate desuccinylase